MPRQVWTRHRIAVIAQLDDGTNFDSRVGRRQVSEREKAGRHCGLLSVVTDEVPGVGFEPTLHLREREV
jgi:hypothetical protein